jgi:hypothetical protein
MVPDVKSEKGDDTNTIITGIDLDCGRILLPEIVTKMSGLGADDEILITASKHSVSITKSCMPKTIKVKKKRAR